MASNLLQLPPPPPDETSSQTELQELVFRGCEAWPELNGTFLRTRDFDQLSPHERPIYQRRVTSADGKELRVLCFFWDFGAQSGPKKAGRSDLGMASIGGDSTVPFQSLFDCHGLLAWC